MEMGIQRKGAIEVKGRFIFVKGTEIGTLFSSRFEMDFADMAHCPAGRRRVGVSCRDPVLPIAEMQAVIHRTLF